MPDNLDHLLSKKLNTTFSTAPEDMWNKIAVDLENAEFDDNLKNCLKENSIKAPVFLWTGIEENLNQQAENSDSKLDHQLRNAYDKKVKAPEHIWYAIEQKLNIDLIWNNMSSEMNRMKSFYLWRKRIVRWGIAALLLLFVRNCDYSHNENKSFVKIEKNPVNKKSEIITGHTDNFERKSGLYHNETEALNLTHANNSKHTVHPKIVQSNVLMTDSSKVNNFRASINLSPEENPKIPDNQFFEQDKILKNLVCNEIGPVSRISTFLQDNLISVPQFEKKNKELKISCELGIITALSYSIPMTTANTKVNLRNGTIPVNTNSPVGLSYGIQIGVNIGNKISLSSELYYRSTVRRELISVHNGAASKHFVDYNYFRTNIVANSSLLKYGTSRNNVIKAGVGFFFSNLQNYSIVSGSNLRYFSKPDINSWNAGIIASVSQQHTFFKHFALEYGLRTDAAFSLFFDKNITKNQQNLNDVGTGFFAAIKYIF